MSENKHEIVEIMYQGKPMRTQRQYLNRYPGATIVEPSVTTESEEEQQAAEDEERRRAAAEEAERASSPSEPSNPWKEDGE